MADIFTDTLKMSDDWGKVITDQFPDGIPASGQAIQNFIKGEINSLYENLDIKPGYFFGVDDEKANTNILLGFVNESAYQKWQTETNANPDQETYKDPTTG